MSVCMFNSGLKVMLCLKESRMNSFVPMAPVAKHFIFLKTSYIQCGCSRFVGKEISNPMQVQTQVLNKNTGPAMKTN